jgi:hypothetical protein
MILHYFLFHNHTFFLEKTMPSPPPLQESKLNSIISLNRVRGKNSIQPAVERAASTGKLAILAKDALV